MYPACCHGPLHLSTFVDWTLRSSSSANLHHIPRTYLHFGSRSFHTAAPTVWNSLPFTLRSSQTLNTFRKHLKTHLFQSAFNSPYRLV